MRKLKNSELRRISVENFKSSIKTPIVVILDNIRSAINVGSVFRTADAFRLEKVYLCGITSTPPHKDIRKSALGATETVEWEYYEDIKNIILHLRSQGYMICSVEQVDGSIMLHKFSNLEKPIAVIFGNEVDGVKQSVIDKSDYCIEVPQIGTKHSLNVSVCVGIVLWDLYKKII